MNAILEAATYILVREGWEHFTTNRVAERAGVNIASLYQYFPNKEAVVAELQRRHSTEIRELFPSVLPQLQSQRELRGALCVIVAAVVREHRVAPGLHRVFAEELPRSARQRETKGERLAQRWSRVLEPFMRNVPDPELAMFVTRCAVHAAVHEAATERPELLERPAFVDEIVTLVERYLDRSPIKSPKVEARSSRSLRRRADRPE